MKNFDRKCSDRYRNREARFKQKQHDDIMAFANANKEIDKVLPQLEILFTPFTQTNPPENSEQEEK